MCNKMQHESITFFIQHRYYKVITEESVTLNDKLSVVVPWSKIIALICFTRKQ